MKASDNPFASLLVVEGAAPTSPSAGDQRLFVDSADHLLKLKNSSGTVTPAGGGLADEGAFTYLDATDGAAPGNPAASHARIYSKSGRFYSRDSSGNEYGPFDVAGGGVYAIDQTFPGSSLPSGWAFTGSGSCAVSGGVALVTSAAQHDRLMYDITPTGQYVVQMHLKSVSGQGGMPSLVVLNSVGTGYGVGPYNDGNCHAWNVTTYGYGSTNDASAPGEPTQTDFWLELMISGGKVIGFAYSADGTTWTTWPMASPGSALTITQVGLCQIYTAANMVASVAEMRICHL